MRRAASGDGSVLQVQLEELQQRCRTLESAVTQSETEKRDLMEHLGKLIQAVDERDAKLKQQVGVCLGATPIIQCLALQVAAEAGVRAEFDASTAALNRTIQQLTAALADKTQQLEQQSLRNQQLTLDIANAAKALETKQGELATALADLQVKCQCDVMCCCVM